MSTGPVAMGTTALQLTLPDCGLSLEMIKPHAIPPLSQTPAGDAQGSPHTSGCATHTPL